MSHELMANEMLAFLQQKLDVMDEVSAVQICSTNFSEEDIAAAKLLLYTTLNKRDQMVSRRRDGTKKSVQDVITLLKETDPDDVPTFVARDLYKLPPVTFDHVDVTSLLKDIIALKASLADVQQKLDASQNTVAELRREVVDLRNTVTRPLYDASNINTRRGAGLDLSTASVASAVLSPTPSSPAELAECASRAPRGSAPVPAAPPRNAARVIDPVPQHMPSVAEAKKRNFADVAGSSSTAPPTQPVLTTTTNQAKEDDFVTVQRRKRRNRVTANRCGNAPVEPKLGVRAAQPNTPVYISRLHCTTVAENIVTYVRQKLQYLMRVQVLESRRNVNFKAFVVRVPNCYLHRVMDENFWPQGVVFRRFRGQVPPERTMTSAK